jgi:hypothetical protein
MTNNEKVVVMWAVGMYLTVVFTCFAHLEARDYYRAKRQEQIEMNTGRYIQQMLRPSIGEDY